MKGKIRQDLDAYVFTTESGEVIENGKQYELRYTNDDVFQVNVDGLWHEMESIDWDF